MLFNFGQGVHAKYILRYTLWNIMLAILREISQHPKAFFHLEGVVNFYKRWAMVATNVGTWASQKPKSEVQLGFGVFVRNLAPTRETELSEQNYVQQRKSWTIVSNTLAAIHRWNYWYTAPQGGNERHGHQVRTQHIALNWRLLANHGIFVVHLLSSKSSRRQQKAHSSSVTSLG